MKLTAILVASSVLVGGLGTAVLVPVASNNTTKALEKKLEEQKKRKMLQDKLKKYQLKKLEQMKSKQKKK